MKTIMAVLFTIFLSALVNAATEKVPCDPSKTLGWEQVEPRLVMILDAHGDHQRVSGDREYRKFECDGKWRYRKIETMTKRKVPA